MIKQAGRDAGQDDRRDVGQNCQRLDKIIVDRPFAPLGLLFGEVVSRKAIRAERHGRLHEIHGALGAQHVGEMTLLTN